MIQYKVDLHLDLHTQDRTDQNLQDLIILTIEIIVQQHRRSVQLSHQRQQYQPVQPDHMDRHQLRLEYLERHVSQQHLLTVLNDHITQLVVKVSDCFIILLLLKAQVIMDRLMDQDLLIKVH